MSFKTILLLIITGLYFWAGQHRYVCGIHDLCGDEKTEASNTGDTAPVEEVDYGPITFKYNDATAYAGPKSFAAFKDGVLAAKKDGDESGKTDDNIMEIVGHYFKGESPEIGLKRAESVRALMAQYFPESRMRLTTKDMSSQEVDANSNFAAADFNWIELEIEEKKAEVIQLADKAVILFPSGSANPQRDANINEYLDKLAQRIKQTGEKVEITGHADNTGTTATNQSLGMKRANTIRRILINNGIDRNLITTDSKGETKPIATNETEAGRHQNRRVEVKLNKEK